jgi:hypothetical protein
MPAISPDSVLIEFHNIGNLTRLIRSHPVVYNSQDARLDLTDRVVSTGAVSPLAVQIGDYERFRPVRALSVLNNRNTPGLPPSQTIVPSFIFRSPGHTPYL